MLVSYTLTQLILSLTTIVCGAYLAFQDWRYERIPVWALCIWGVLSIYKGLTTQIDIISMGILCLISLCLTGYQFIRCIRIIAPGDLLIFATMGLWLDAAALPAFLLLTGALGITSCIILRKSRFPFLPSLFLAFAYSYFFNEV